MRELSKNQIAAIAYIQLFNAGEGAPPDEAAALEVIAENRLKDLGYPTEVPFDNEGEPMIRWDAFNLEPDFNFLTFTTPIMLSIGHDSREFDLRNLETYAREMEILEPLTEDQLYYARELTLAKDASGDYKDFFESLSDSQFDNFKRAFNLTDDQVDAWLGRNDELLNSTNLKFISPLLP